MRLLDMKHVHLIDGKYYLSEDPPVEKDTKEEEVK